MNQTFKNTNIYDSNLNPLLDRANNEDLETLVDYLKNKLSEQLTGHNAYKAFAPDHNQYADLIAKEIRDMGGNTFANLFRGEGPSYHEIVRDVANKLKAPYNKNQNIEQIEQAILETILQKALAEMSEAEKEQLLSEMGDKGSIGKGGMAASALIGIFRAGGFYSYQLTLIIANQIARLILGRGLMLATNAGLMRAASILTGPIGMGISAAFMAVDIAGPAYKVTIPCVIHIAMLRKKYVTQHCTNCQHILNDLSIKFCPECGHKITPRLPNA